MVILLALSTASRAQMIKVEHITVTKHGVDINIINLIKTIAIAITKL